MNEIPPFDFSGFGLSMPESDPYANVGLPPAIPKAYEMLTPGSAAVIQEIAKYGKERVSEKNLIANAKLGMSIEDQDLNDQRRATMEQQIQDIETKRTGLVNAQSDIAGHQELQTAISEVMAGRPVKNVPKVIANPSVWQSIAGALGGILDPKRASEYAQIPGQVAKAQQNDANTQQMLEDQMAEDQYQGRLSQANQNYDRFAKMDQFRVKESNDSNDQVRDDLRGQSSALMRAIQNIDNAELRAMIAGQNNQTKRDIAADRINAQMDIFRARSNDSLLKLAATAGSNEERDAITGVLAERGITFTPPKTTAKQKGLEIRKGEADGRAAERKLDMDYKTMRNKFYPSEVKKRLEVMDQRIKDSNSAIAKRASSGGGGNGGKPLKPGQVPNEVKASLKLQMGAFEYELKEIERILASVKRGETNLVQGLSIEAILSRKEQLDKNLLVTKQKHDGKRPLAQPAQAKTPNGGKLPPSSDTGPVFDVKGGNSDVVRRRIRAGTK